jgi:hypothetical protein
MEHPRFLHSATRRNGALANRKGTPHAVQQKSIDNQQNTDIIPGTLLAVTRTGGEMPWPGCI